MRFMCKNCRYKFESKEDKTGKMCPYCGERAVAQEPSAEDLLNEVE
ncbi:hypothetical protein M0R19_08600 [Candidatus Pacearchaeota archaeon]|nr:hypothetical protein [Candidatus Pacearchaeota archaeon]